MYTIENDKLRVVINPTGAELASLIKKSNQREYLWQGDPEIWASQAPVLFPNIGGFKDGTYTYNGKSYSLPKHGFIRYNEGLFVVENSSEKLVLGLQSSSKTLAVYPFHFDFSISFELSDDELRITHSIENTGEESLYFSVGGHPAFICPSFPETAYDEYYITLENGHSTPSYLLNDMGIITSKTVSVFAGDRIPLTRELFANDALIFKNIQAEKATLHHQTKGEVLSITFSDFPDLGIWAKPKGDFVCIEPWLGYADVTDSNQKLSEKEGIQTLGVGKTHRSFYEITIA